MSGSPRSRPATAGSPDCRSRRRAGAADAVLSFEYDNLGCQTRASDTLNISVLSTYDALGRKVAESSSGRAMTSAYDAGGRRVRLTWADGVFVTYVYSVTGAAVADDSVRVLELGGRLPLVRGLAVSGSASWTDWRDAQSDVLTTSGLVATRNVGHAHIPSLSISADWQRPAWFANGSLLLQRPRLERTSANAESEDLRLPVVPDLAASSRAGAQGLFWRAGVEGRVTGGSRLSFDPQLDQEIGEFGDVALCGSADAGRWTVSARLDNLFDGRADRLGYGNSFTVLRQPQYVPQIPRRVSFSFTYGAVAKMTTIR